MPLFTIADVIYLFVDSVISHFTSSNVRCPKCGAMSKQIKNSQEENSSSWNVLMIGR